MRAGKFAYDWISRNMMIVPNPRFEVVHPVAMSTDMSSAEHPTMVSPMVDKTMPFQDVNKILYFSVSYDFYCHIESTVKDDETFIKLYGIFLEMVPVEITELYCSDFYCVIEGWQCCASCHNEWWEGYGEPIGLTCPVEGYEHIVAEVCCAGSSRDGKSCELTEEEWMRAILLAMAKKQKAKVAEMLGWFYRKSRYG